MRIKPIKRNRAIALGSILAVAGCSAGGSTAAPTAKPAADASRPQSVGRLTINPTLLSHASSARRPAFVDVNGDGKGGSLSLVITSIETTDGLGLQPPATTIPISVGASNIQVSLPLYGPGGFIRVQEFNQPLATSPAQLIADTDGNTDGGFGNFAYTISAGAASASLGTVTLQAVIGGIVLSDSPEGTSNVVFVPNGNATPVSYTVGQTTATNFVYAFPADAAGNFTNLSVVGGFPNAVMLSPFQSFTELNVLATSILGSFVIAPVASCPFYPPGHATTPVSLQATDAFLNTATANLTFKNGGSLNTNCS